MAQTKFSVSWESYQKNICNGLSALQQRGEFVDMTLAADGHHVKVHKMVMSLVSPYIKELISSADCAHPVIFLNQISFKTLCAILEYIYTGEVLVEKENLNSFVIAGKALHIKGLQDMSVQHSMSNIHTTSQHMSKDMSVKDEKDFIKVAPVTINKDGNMHEVFINEGMSNMDDVMDNTFDDSMEHDYTMEQGKMQESSTSAMMCPASVVTKNDVIVQRIAAHNHPFHDQKILKKVQANAIFSALQQAEIQGQLMQKERLDQSSTRNDHDDSDANK
ncbi:hypothetical protein K1T71_008563 [Dendrolimus kikuchii]|uniref:Uncharacterized protein n=1 Tax=Dendrolimus kikuchii TaxID=765133 RepID=A0ACC1CVB9_9NEOP|nr:hypothetical protein K1T71_008563 [Dendrolimus kikuchii]